MKVQEQRRLERLLNFLLWIHNDSHTRLILGTITSGLGCIHVKEYEFPDAKGTVIAADLVILLEVYNKLLRQKLDEMYCK